MKSKGFNLLGFDTFEGEYYPLPGVYHTYKAALNAARARLKALEMEQPSQRSGGQSGIQDQVFIQRPNGNIERILL